MHELNFNAQSGSISSGKIEHGFGRNVQMCELLPMDAKLNINEFEESLGNAFTYERSFKVGLVSS